MTAPVTNIQRAAWANAGLLDYSQAKDETRFLYEERETVFGDMLCDLMHLADQYGYNWQEHLGRAAMHYEAETSDEGAAS